MQITFLGTGTSVGVPVIGCECTVCSSTNHKDNRLRSSVMIEWQGKRIVIDAGPDFRQQMLRERIKHLDAILFTHEHKDHLGGLDDTRPFNFLYQNNIPLYVSSNVEESIRREYYYAFGEHKYPGAPELNLVHINETESFLVHDIVVSPIRVLHGPLPILGFRLGDFVYITDAKTIPPEELYKFTGCDTLVVNAIRKEPHFSHFNLEEALAFIKLIKPKRAYLTHISHLLGLHDSINGTLPDEVFLAYDGLTIAIK